MKAAVIGKTTAQQLLGFDIGAGIAALKNAEIKESMLSSGYFSEKTL
jgi:hypothetical protein